MNLTESQVRDIFRTIFYSDLEKTNRLTIEPEDYLYAEYFLKELVRGSLAMSSIEALFRSSFGFKPSLFKIVREIAGSALRSKSIIDKGMYYVCIRNVIAIRWRSQFEIRAQLGEWGLPYKSLNLR
jgi:hypothetical protein